MSKKSIFIFSLIVFLFSLGIRFYWVKQKVSLHVDEVFTTIISNNSHLGWNRWFPDRIFVKNDNIKNLLFPDSSFKDYKKDIKSIYLHNNFDTAHPNLYYLLFRTISVNAGKMSVEKVIFYGFALNVLIFCCSFWLLYKILSILFEKQKEIIPLGLLVAFANTASVSMTIFARPYELQMFGFILASFLFLKILDCINNSKFSVKNLLLIALLSSIIFLTGYLIVLYYGFLLLYITCMCIINKKFQYLNSIFLIGIFGVILTLIFYPDYFAFLNSQRMQTSSFSNIYQFFEYLKLIFFNIIDFIIYLPVLIFMAFVFVFQHKNLKNIDDNCYVLLGFSIIWLFVAMYIAPFKILRYIAPCASILSLFIPVAYLLLKNIKVKKSFIVLLTLYYIILPFFALKIESYDNAINYFEPSIKIVPHIENTFYTTKKSMRKINEIKTPIVIKYDYYWQTFVMVLNAGDNQIFGFVSNFGKDDEDKIRNEQFMKNLKFPYLYAVSIYNIEMGNQLKKRYSIFEVDKNEEILNHYFL